jgi:outer membrane protein
LEGAKEETMTPIQWTRLAGLTAGLLLAAGFASAQVKVGVVDLQKALQSTAEIKQAEADLKARFGPRQDELSALEKEIAKLQQDYDQNQSKYNDVALAELQGKITTKQRQYQRNAQALQDEVNRDRQDILNRVGQRLKEVVEKVAAEKGLDIVVDSTSTLYVKPVLDISTDVTAAYDKAYPVKK